MTITANDEPTEIEADVDKRFSSIVVNLPVQQTGTGTPSPTNPRPFTVWTDVSLYVSDTEEADEPTLSIELPTPLYGGKIDMVRGEIATTYNSKESGTGWEMTEEGQFRCQVSAYNNGDETSTNVADLYAVHYETVSNKDAYDATDDLTCGLATIDGTTYLYVNDAQYTTLETFATHIADEVFVFRAHIPMSDVTEPHIVYLPEGTSYVWADAGFVDYTVSGTPPLSLPNSLGKPLKAWEVELSPYQEGSGDPSPDNVRPIYGTDKLTIYTDSKYGGLVEWNQLVVDGNFTDTDNWYVTAYNIAVNNNILTIGYTSNSTASSNVSGNTLGTIEGHNYLVSAQVFYPKAGSQAIFIGSGGYQGVQKTITAFNEWVDVSGIFTRTTGGNDKIAFYPRMTSGSGWTDGDSVQIKNLFVCDLTAMFGAGNEPSTVEEFRALFPNDYYAYNAGQQMTVDQVNGAQYSPAVITLPQTVYTGTIGSEGGESRWGEVDLGTLSWSAYSSGVNTYRAQVSGKAFGDSNVLTDIYATRVTAFSNMDNCTIRGTSGNTYIYVRDDAYTDVNSFKQAVTGHKLIYELETPTTFAVPTATIPTPTGTATTWATAEDGTVDGMEVTYVGKPT